MALPQDAGACTPASSLAEIRVPAHGLLHRVCAPHQDLDTAVERRRNVARGKVQRPSKPEARDLDLRVTDTRSSQFTRYVLGALEADGVGRCAVASGVGVTDDEHRGVPGIAKRRRDSSYVGFRGLVERGAGLSRSGSDP